MSTIGPVAQQGIISTQVEHVVVERPAAATEMTTPPPPPPPPEAGRGITVDTSA